MEVNYVVHLLTDGSSDLTNASERHIKCRDCGANLTVDDHECPDCGGEIIVYDPS